MKRKYLLALALLAAGGGAHAQTGVGIGTTTPAASAVLELNSTNKGFLPPRMTQAQMNAITGAAKGLMLWCVDCSPEGFRVYNGTQWVALGSGTSTATFTPNSLDCKASIAPTGRFQQGRPMNGTSTKQVAVAFNAIGGYAFGTDTVNGVYFRASGYASEAGTNTATLVAYGTPLAKGAFNYKVSATSQAPCTFPVTYEPVAVYAACSTLVNNMPPVLTNGQTYSQADGTVTIGYTAGNDQTYPALDGTAVSGLRLSRVAGTFDGSGGTITYAINGTYTGATNGNITLTLPDSACAVPTGAATYVTSSVSCNGPTSGLYRMLRPMDTFNKKSLSINVATVGGWRAVSTTQNGVSFSGTGRFSATGTQTAVLTATGTPAASGTFTYSVNLGGQTCTFDITYGAIAIYNCAAATNTFTPTGPLNPGTSYSGKYTLPYTAGNGQSYPSATLTANGLTLTRDTGTYDTAGGNVVYTLSGTYSGGVTSQTFSLQEGCQVNIGSATYAASSLNCISGTAAAGTYQQASAMTSGNTKGISVSVNSTGSWQASTNTVNGVTFSGSGTFSNTGVQNVTLTAGGTPVAPGLFTYTVSLDGQTCTFDVNYGPAASFICSGAAKNFSPTGALANGTTYSGTYSLPYTGGNGKAYPSAAVTANGLTLTRTAGTFAPGSGNVNYTLSGTYTGNAVSQILNVVEGCPVNIGAVVVSTLAGSSAGFTDGPSGLLNDPYAIAGDGSGNFYIADNLNHSIRKVTGSGVVSTVAGNGTSGYVDNTGSIARFNGPAGVALDGAGNLYVADYNNNVIRKIVLSSGAVSTFAGSGTVGDLDNGVGTSAQFNGPFGLAVDGGNLYVADQHNHRIRKISLSGTNAVTTVAGSTQGLNNATGTAAQFSDPTGLAADGLGNLYVVDRLNNRIRQIVLSTAAVTTIAGSSQNYADGTGANAMFNNPWGATMDGAGNLYVADRGNHRIRKIILSSATKDVSTVAGIGSGFADGTSATAQFNNPSGVAVGPAGNIFVTDQSNNRVRKIVP